MAESRQGLGFAPQTRTEKCELLTAIIRLGGVLMKFIRVRYVTIVLLFAVLVSAISQTTTATAAQTPENSVAPTSVPEMVCWGNGPPWSIQFASWGARYVGMSQPDQTFRGHFYWASEDKVWVWQLTLGVDPISGHTLSAVIRETSCIDTVQSKTYPYSAQVSLPQGDTVNGCCHKLKAGGADRAARCTAQRHAQIVLTEVS
jgi:uncharacterized membrane protein